jgi:hypothetical protein
MVPRALLVLGMTSCLGCGGKAEPINPAALTAPELLDLLEDDLKRHDPKHFVELDLGKYKVTHVVEQDGAPTPLAVRFQLFVVLPENRKEEFEIAFATYEKRVRDAILETVQHADTNQLTDPGLRALKDHLLQAIQQVSKSRVLKDVVFSEFSLTKT